MSHRFLIFYCLFIAIIICSGCKKSNKYEAQKFLGITNLSSSNINFLKVVTDPSYNRPYCVFIKLKYDSLMLKELISKLGLVSYTSHFIDSMCLQNTDSLFIHSLLGFKSRYQIETEPPYREVLSWWDPPNEKSVLFGSFYKENGFKTVRCYSEKWDGRLILTYNTKTEFAYILIEIYQ